MTTNSVMIQRREPEQWVPVWWHRRKGERIQAIAGNPSLTGKTVRVRASFKFGGQVERYVNPKNLEPRSQDLRDRIETERKDDPVMPGTAKPGEPTHFCAACGFAHGENYVDCVDGKCWW